MRAAATEVPGGEEVEVGEDLLQDGDLHLVVDLHQEEAHLHAGMDLPVMMVSQYSNLITSSNPHSLPLCRPFRLEA